MRALRFAAFAAAGLLFCGGLIATPPSAQADDITPPPYRGQPCSTHGQWTIGGGLTGPSTVACPAASGFSDINPLVGVQPDVGIITIDWPNFIDELPLKRIHLQITFEGQQSTQIFVYFQATDGDNTEQFLGEGPDATASCTECTSGNLYWFRDWLIFPNPDFERFILTWNPAVTLLPTQIVIDTVSAPEPGTLAVLGLGLATFGLMRRRRTALAS